MNIIIAIILFSAIVLFHELGHFLLAKKNGITVTEFSLGMGPRLISTEKGGTRYSLKLFPIGGSCLMVGEDDDDTSEGSFNSASVWGRISVIAAGPVFNFIMAFVLAMIITSVIGYDPATVLRVEKGSAAEEAGLLEGDVITKFQNKKVQIGRDLDLYMTLHGMENGDISMTVLRDGEKKNISFKAKEQEKYMLGFSYKSEGVPEVLALQPGMPMYEAGIQVGDIITGIDGMNITSSDELQSYFEEHPLEDKRITVSYRHNDIPYETMMRPKMTKQVSTGFVYNVYREKTDFLGVLKYSAVEVRYWVSSTLESVGMLIKGKFSVNDLSGPVGIVEVIGDSYEEVKSEGAVMVWMQMLYWGILLSANLGVMNLLPIPALDGGRLVFLLIEAIRGKELNREVEGMVHFIGFVLLMILMVFVLFNDLKRL